MTKNATSQKVMNTVERVVQNDEDEVVWISEDQIFDILFALCDLLHEDGCARTSHALERAIDAFLFDTGKAQSNRRTQPNKHIARKPKKPLQITDQSERARAKRVAEQSKRMAEAILNAQKRQASASSYRGDSELGRTGTDPV